MSAHHIEEAVLALAATRDLDWRQRIEVWLHVRSCPDCGAALESYRRLTDGLKKGESSPGIGGEDWAALEREMRANIGLGLAAGRIVDTEPERIRTGPAEPAGWRVAVVMATLTVVLASGWLLRRPAPGVAGPGWGPAVAEASAEGVGIHEGQAGMMLLTPARDSSVMLAGTSGGARARFIDAETGQVTIHHVALGE